MKYFFIFLFYQLALAQPYNAKKTILIRQETNAYFKNPNYSPLQSDEIKNFKSLNYYKIDSKYYVKATVSKVLSMPKISLLTSKGTTETYQQMLKLNFKIAGKNYALFAYQPYSNQKLPKSNRYLIPFKDLTNKNETYSNGRYIDLMIPNHSKSIYIDFNLAYNPYCAYSKDYICPIAPNENKIDNYIKAGAKTGYQKY